MKMDRYSWIGASFLALLLLIPILLGRVPAMPKKGGHGWTPSISMREEPQKFWRYETTEAVIAIILFGGNHAEEFRPWKPPRTSMT
jgi:hypothetical protein